MHIYEPVNMTVLPALEKGSLPSICTQTLVRRCTLPAVRRRTAKQRNEAGEVMAEGVRDL